MGNNDDEAPRYEVLEVDCFRCDGLNDGEPCADRGRECSGPGYMVQFWTPWDSSRQIGKTYRSESEAEKMAAKLNRRPLRQDRAAIRGTANDR